MNLNYLIPLLVLALSTFTSCRSSMSDEKAKSIAFGDATGGVYYISGTDRFSFSRFDYVGDTAMSKIKHGDDVLYARGAYAIESDGDTSTLKFGEWIEYHPKGEIQSKGSYGIAKYVQCCAGGACMSYYDYKYGKWEYYYPSGRIRAKGIYQLSPERIRTSCKGGAIYLESRRNEDWVFYDADGNQIEAEEGELSDPSN